MSYSIKHLQGANVAQSVEQLTRNEQVIGSIPIIGSIFFALKHRENCHDICCNVLSFGCFFCFFDSDTSTLNIYNGKKCFFFI